MYIAVFTFLLFFYHCLAMELPIERMSVKNQNSAHNASMEICEAIDFRKAIAQLGQDIIHDLDAEHDAVRTVFFLLSETLEGKEYSQEEANILKEMLAKLKQPQELVNSANVSGNLSVEDAVFTTIREQIEWFSTKLDDCGEKLSGPLRESLGKVIECYKKFVVDLVKTNDLGHEAQQKARQTLLEEKVSMCLDAFGDIKFFLISQAWARQLGNTKENGTRLKERMPGQNHDTYVSKSGKVYFKSDRAQTGLKPEYEIAIYGLYSILFPHIRVITPSCFIACNNVIINGKKETFYFQATTTIDGVTLGKILGAAKIEELGETHRQFFGDGLYKNVNFESFSALVLGSFLVNPADWKPANLIMQKNGIIVGIDNDEAFAYPIVQMKNGPTKDLNYIGVKDILYFMHELMSKPIHPRLAKRLKEIDPQTIFKEWLTFLKEKERSYEKLKKYSFTPNELYEPPQLSIKFAPDILKQMVLNLSELKSHAAVGEISHKKIFYEMQEFVMRYYEALADEYPNVKDAYTELNACREKYSLQDILDLKKPARDGRPTFKVLRTENHSSTEYEDKTKMLGIDTALDEFNQTMLSNKGQTKLHEAVINTLKDGPDALNCIEELKKQGIDFDAQDKEGNTALDLAFGSSREPAGTGTIAQNRKYAVQKLINWKAGKRIKMDRALHFFKRYEELAATAIQLESTNAEFAWRRLLDQVFSETKVEGKECRATCFNKKRYVAEKFCNELWDKNNKFKPKNRCPNPRDPKKCTVANCKHLSYGRREVSYLEIGGKKMWFKRFPNVSGFEHAASRLVHHLIGYGSTFNELVFINDEFYMVSFGIEGDNLQELFSRPENKNRNPECLNNLDPQEISAMIVATMIIAPEDEKPDNLQVDKTGAKPRLVCIDKENSFFPAYIRGANGMPIRAIKSIFFCLDQMKDKVHPAVRGHFLAMEPFDLFTKWLQEIDGYHQMCLSMKHNEKTGTTDERIVKLCKDNMCYIGVPFAPGMLKRAYNKFVKLRDQLLDNPDITHIDLLLKLYPQLEDYKSCLHASLTVYDRFIKADFPLYNVIKGVPVSHCSTKEVLEALSIPYQGLDGSISKGTCYNPSQGLKEIEEMKKSRQILQLGGKAEEFTKMDDLQKEKYLASTDFARKKDGKMVMPLSEQETFFKLNAFTQTPWHNLTITNAEGLTLAIMASLNLANVTKLTLSGCTHLNDTIVPILKNCNLLEKLNLSALENLIQFGQSGIFGNTPFTLPNLRVLIISKCKQLKEILLEVPTLTKMTADKCPNLSKLGITCSSLKSLDIREDMLIESEVVNKITENCPRLKRLYLTEDKITYAKIRQTDPQYPVQVFKDLPKSITDAIVSSTSLNTIDLGKENKVNDADFKKLCKFLEDGNLKPYIQNLDLGVNPITDEGMKDLANVINKNNVIEELNLGDTKCTHEGIYTIVQALLNNKSVTKLHLGEARKPSDS